MNSEAPSVYEQLSLEAAARVDAVCDRFETGWKAARSSAATPRVSTYLDGFDGAERTILTRELLELDRDCRARYGVNGRLEGSHERATVAEAVSSCAARSQRRQNDPPAGEPAYWPEVDGLVFVEVLGSGGMGVVFKARQIAQGRDVAVKFLRDANRAEPGRRERFAQEARAIARLRHPHLVQLYEFGEVPAAGGAASQPYLVLEYVSGGSLADVLRGSPQPPSEAARLVATLADAIHYAHEQGVIHRDLKPANVLLHVPEGNGDGQSDVVRGPRISAPRPLTADLCAKVTDFGLAKFLAGGDLTHSGDVVGTPSYMAPEQAAGKSAPITAAVDVYGLGAILYEALTGRPPFAAATVDATLGLVRQDEPIPPRRLQPTVPRDLETICLKCLRKEAGRRYATAQDLGNDLRRFQAGAPVLARPVGTTERAIIWCSRRPSFAGLLTALVLVFLAGGSGVLWQWQRAQVHAARAQQNATAFRRERDTARSEKARAERHLHIVRDRVDRLRTLGKQLLARPGQYRTGHAVLAEALAFYQELLPDEGTDRTVRQEAAQLFGLVADIHHTLDQPAKAAEAWARQASLLTSLLEEEPGSKDLRRHLADSHRWRGNALRDHGNLGAAREAYDQAAQIQEGLLRESPNEPRFQLGLSNTLLNKIGLNGGAAPPGEIEPIYSRIMELDRAAVRTAPEDDSFNAELALALGEQGMFFLETGRIAQAEAAVREAVGIHERVLAGGKLKRSVERYVARNFVNLGRVLVTAGRARAAEPYYRKALSLLDQLVTEIPESVHARNDLARALPHLANLFKDLGRWQELVEVRQRIVQVYETLKAKYPDDPEHRRNLAVSYLELAFLLYGRGRQAEGAEPYRKALALEEENPAVNNDLAWFLATGPEPCLRDAPRALRLAQKAVKAYPDAAIYRNTLGVAHYRCGDDKAAVAALEKSMSLHAGGDPYDWLFLAMAHWRLGDRDEARAFFDRSVEWLANKKSHDDELCRYRIEAQAVLAGPCPIEPTRAHFPG